MPAYLQRIFSANISRAMEPISPAQQSVRGCRDSEFSETSTNEEISSWRSTSGNLLAEIAVGTALALQVGLSASSFAIGSALTAPARGRRLAVAAPAFALGCLSIKVDAPLLEPGAGRTSTHRTMPLDPEAEHRRIPPYCLHSTDLARMHTLRVATPKLVPARDQQHRNGADVRHLARP